MRTTKMAGDIHRGRQRKSFEADSVAAVPSMPFPSSPMLLSARIVRSRTLSHEFVVVYLQLVRSTVSYPSAKIVFRLSRLRVV